MAELILTKESEKMVKEYVLDILSERVLARAQENLSEMKKVDTGYLMGSGYVERGDNSRKIGFSAPYAPNIEFGALPFRMDYKILIPWVRRKLRITDIKEAKRVAYFISRKIAWEGTKPTPYLLPAVKQVLG